MTDDLKLYDKSIDTFVLHVTVHYPNNILTAMGFELKINARIFNYCLHCALRHEGDRHGGKFR